MKQFKLLLLVLLVTAISTSTYAGDKFGIRAGWQYSNIHNGSTSLGEGALNSFYIGLFKEKNIVPFLKIGIGLEYSQIGSTGSNADQIKFHYLSSPVYAKVKLGPIYGLVGGAPAFKVGESWDLATGADAAEEIFNSNSFDLPVFAGLGVNILMLRIEARYYWGTMDVSGNALYSDYKNQQFQLGLGLAI